ncbi:hypothetical protein WN944_010633 [Citrus x changshan-huyou]|uniref:Uncharacterized protein n=1 Tax=Citrus x changshan-huyou TaxID=2935761 RepID=A0AAP0MUI5_9ROSI
MAFISKFLRREVLTSYKDGFYLLKSLVDGISGLISETVRSCLHIKGINFDLPHAINIAPIYDGVIDVSGPIRRAPAKKINEAIQGFVQATLDEFNSTSISRKQIFKMGLKDEVLALVYLIRANEVAGVGECWGYGAPTSFYMLAEICATPHVHPPLSVKLNTSMV